jgi:type II secretory ATPase GspE/PulE/Tfp pilus assembly ATPase PilB-like protein
MGGKSSKAKNQVLITGPTASGKTTLLYSQKLDGKEFKINPTVGF